MAGFIAPAGISDKQPVLRKAGKEKPEHVGSGRNFNLFTLGYSV